MIKWIVKYKDLLTLIVAIVAIGLSILSFIKSCTTESDLEKTNYALSSIEHRPRLKFSNPQINLLTLSSDSIPIKLTNDPADSIGDLKVNIEMKVKICVTNIGNSTAKIVGWTIADTISNEPILKQFLKDKNRFKLESKNDLKFPNLYQELTPFDSCNIELKYTPQWIKNNKFIIHILLFYENEIDQLFDTYYWIIVKTNEIILPNPIFINNNRDTFNNLQSEMFRIIDIEDENNYSSIYSEQQKKELIEKINH